jgi:hypothetical protein
VSIYKIKRWKMKKIIRLILLLCSVLLPAAALYSGDAGVENYRQDYLSYMQKPTAELKQKLAEAGDRIKPALIEEFLQKSGIAIQLRDMTGMIQGMAPVLLSGSGIEQDEKAKQKFNEITGGILDPDKMLVNIRSYFGKYYSAPALMDNLLWLDSKTGVKMTGLEIAETKNIEELRNYVKGFREADITPARKKLYKSLVQVDDSDNTSGEIGATIVRQILQGFNETVEENYRIPAEKIETMAAKAGQNANTPERKLQSLAMKAYTYSSATDAELSTYIKFLGSPSGIWGVKAVKNSLLSALASSSREFGMMSGKYAADLRAQGGSKDAWQEYAFKEEKCSVKMPAKPGYQQKDVNTEAGVKRITLRTAETDSAAYSMVASMGYVDRELDQKTTEKVLMGAAKGSAQQNKILSTNYIKFGPYEGIDVVFSGKGVTTHNRIILAGRDFYQLLYLCADNDNDTGNLRKFQDSFSLDAGK